MRTRYFIAFISAIFLIQAAAMASPARVTRPVLKQPDGSTFNAILRGDEFMKILTTEDGCAIIQDENGWYCYAFYSPDGEKLSSGIRVGQAVPAATAADSRRIPYGTLYAKASAKRASAPKEKMNLMMSLRSADAAAVKSGEMKPQEKHGLILLVQFKDLKFTYTRNDFISLIKNGARDKGGAIDYFNAQFDGQYEFSFDISDIITLNENYSYYGENDRSGNDSRPAEMVRDACKLADGKTDFSKYDDNKDGTVDNVFVFYAGPDEAEGEGEDYIWSHAWYIRQGAGLSLSLDGVKIDRYACTSELSLGTLAGIGTFCHEYSHTFGLPDLYDTDYMGSGGESDALWASTSLMDGGNMNNNGDTPPYFNAIEREILGIASGTEISEPGTYELAPINESNMFYRIGSSTPGEYYILECREAKGWDKYIGGSGMLIYHVDKSGNDSGYGMTAASRWSDVYNMVNCNPDHECADLVEASRPANGKRQATGTIFFPYGSTDSFTSGSARPFLFWNGDRPGFDITGITRDGSSIRFDAVPPGDSGIPVPVTTGKDVFQDAAIISWSIGMNFSGKVWMEWGKAAGSAETVEMTPYASTGNRSDYAVVLDGLSPDTDYMVSIFCTMDGKTGSRTDAGFRTKPEVKGGRPYIYLKYVERNDDGTFPSGARLPLRLFNATGAEQITWTMDGKTVKPGADGYFTPQASGSLKAVVSNSDGTQDIIVKEIIIKNTGE